MTYLVLKMLHVVSVVAFLGNITTGLFWARHALGTGWILWPIVLFSISGAVFGMRIAPLQRQILDTARNAESVDATWPTYDAQFRRWEAWGLVALLAPVAALVIMVLKPALPAL